MTRGAFIKGAMSALFGLFVVLGVVGLVAGREGPGRVGEGTTATWPAHLTATTSTHQGLIHGRVTTDDGSVYQGRLRFGGDEEALWSNFFNGRRSGNPWADHAPRDRLPRERHRLDLFGFEIGVGVPYGLGRPFMVRFGDIARLEARGRDLRVTLRSGTVVELDRYAADDFADGLRVWDDRHGVLELGERRVRTIEFLPGPGPGPDPEPETLYGTVGTSSGDFTGLIQWDREACLRSDALNGHTAHGEVSLPFDAVGSITRLDGAGARVALLDGREIVLSDTRRDGRGNRGMYVDDPRYGRVLVSWDAFRRVDFGSGSRAPAYSDFPTGRPLTGSVTTRSGRRLAGRLVYDLDESETTETLDAPRRGVDYTIPFGLVASIEPPGAKDGPGAGVRVRLHGGEELLLEEEGDLGEHNAGLLVFPGDGGSPGYVPFTEVARIDFDRPPATYPPIGRP